MVAHTQPQSRDIQARRRLRPNSVAAGILLLIVGFLFLYRLDVSPAPHFDEGAFLKVAKNYALNGVYADFSDDGNRYTGAVVSTGPTILLPIAIVFRLADTSILGGRVIAVAYAVLTLLAFFFLATRLLDQRFAVAAVLFAVISPNLKFVEFSRTVMGELPGLFFLFAGLGLWIVAAKRGVIYETLVGICFGLACVTKNQYAMFILPGIAVCFLLNIFYYRKRKWHYYVIPGLLATALYATWTYYVLFQLGAASRDVAYDVAHLRSMSSSSFFVFDGTAINNNLAYLSASPFLLPGLLYAAIKLLDRSDSGEQNWSILLIFGLFAGGMFVLSDGWSRYAILPVGVCLLLELRLLYALTDRFNIHWSDIRAAVRGKPLSYPMLASILIGGLLVTSYARPFYLQMKAVFAGGSDGIYRLTEYIEENVPTDAVIATWETEVASLTDRTFHNPPYSVFVELQARLRAMQGSLHDLYVFPNHVDAEYILIGSQAKRLGLYDPDHFADYALVFSADDYDLYQRMSV